MNSSIGRAPEDRAPTQKLTVPGNIHHGGHGDSKLLNWGKTVIRLVVR